MCVRTTIVFVKKIVNGLVLGVVLGLYQYGTVPCLL